MDTSIYNIANVAYRNPKSLVTNTNIANAISNTKLSQKIGNKIYFFNSANKDLSNICISIDINNPLLVETGGIITNKSMHSFREIAYCPDTDNTSVFLFSAYNSNLFYKYNIVNETLEQLTNSPVSASKLISDNRNLYIVNSKTMYKYDWDTKEWNTFATITNSSITSNYVYIKHCYYSPFLKEFYLGLGNSNTLSALDFSKVSLNGTVQELSPYINLSNFFEKGAGLPLVCISTGNETTSYKTAIYNFLTNQWSPSTVNISNISNSNSWYQNKELWDNLTNDLLYRYYYDVEENKMYTLNYSLDYNTSYQFNIINNYLPSNIYNNIDIIEEEEEEEETSIVNSIQRGIVSFNSTNSVTVPISKINPNKAIVTLRGDTYEEEIEKGSNSYAYAYSREVYVKELSATSLKLANPINSSSTVSYQIVEYK